MQNKPLSNTNTCKNILTTCLSGLASALLTPLLACIALITVTIRLLVSFYLWVVYNGKTKLISSMDSFQVFDKPNNILETYTLIVLQGKADITKIRTTFKDKIINNRENLYEKLKCRVTKKFGFYCWENIGSNFDIKRHVRFMGTDLDPKRSWKEDDVLQNLSEMYSSPLSIELPRWELVVVPNFVYTGANPQGDTGTECYALIFRLHHSIMDGISTYLMFCHVFADYPVETAINPMKPINTKFAKKLGVYLKLLILWPKMVYENVAVEAEHNCFHGPALTSQKLIAWSRPIQLEAVKKIRKTSKCSTAAVLNSAVGGAFRQVALNKSLSVPVELTAVTSIPMLPYPNLKPQNRFSGAFFPLQIGNCSRLNRIRRTDQTLKDIVESGLILINSMLLRFIGILPGSMSQNMTDSRELTCLTSNIPGPIKPTFIFGGDRLVDVGGWLPIKNKTGFGFCFVTYCGLLRVSIVTDLAIASKSDVNMLLEAFEKEIELMEDETMDPDQWV